MTTYVMRNGELIEKHLAGPRDGERADATYVISDTMAETRHMADGKYYTSKSEFRKATRAAGCVEVGNETSTLLKPREPVRMDSAKRREDIQRAIHQLRNGR